jgi:hypothetical protein
MIVMKVDLESIGLTKLVNQSLRPLGLLHDTLLVILSNRSRQFVVVHGRPVLSLSPQSSNLNGVLNLEDPL